MSFKYMEIIGKIILFGMLIFGGWIILSVIIDNIGSVVGGINKHMDKINRWLGFIEDDK